MARKQLSASRLPALLLSALLAVGMAGCVAPAEPAAADIATAAPTGAATGTAAPTEAATETATAAPTGAATEAATEPAVLTAEGHPIGWTTASHSNDVDPNYAVVFPQDKVNEITITIAPEDWAAMQANMVELVGEPGTRGPGGGPGEPPPAPPAAGERPAGPGPGGMGMGGGDMVAGTPLWVPATIEFNGVAWNHAGVRYKGNSSLVGGWNSGSLKLPFKFDFDQFEDDYPEIKNQRFYGFKQLSLANGFADDTFMRDALAYDLLAEAGLPAAETAFYRLTLDYGEGPVALGVYTVVEVIDDTVIPSYFGSDNGNIYEGDGAAAGFAEGTFGRIADSFQKENNRNAADWSDVEALYNVLHSETRTADPAAWQAELEAIFDVDAFLEWLAIGAELAHWDAYGAMSHNYYLYNDPATGKLTWISWDHNMVLQSGGPGGMGAENAPPGEAAPAGDAAQPPRGPGGPGRGVTFDRADVGEQWPLIRYLLDVPEYYDRYIGYLEETSSTIFTAERLTEKIRAMEQVVGPAATEELGAETFSAAVEALIGRVEAQAAGVQTFLAEQP